MTTSLTSLGVLCDDGCVATFDRHRATVTKDGKTVLVAPRKDRLWVVPPTEFSLATSSSQPVLRANLTAPTPLTTSTTSELMQFLHGSLYSPSQSTLIKSIDANFLSTFPGLTTPRVRRFLPKSVHTDLGHLDQLRQGTRSTQPKPPKQQQGSNQSSTQPTESLIVADDEHDFEATPRLPGGKRTHQCYFNVVPIETGKTFSDQTGAYPVISTRGMRYIMMFHDYDSNAILGRPIRNRTGAELLQTFKEVHKYLCDRGLRPQYHVMDNECPNALKQFMREENMTFQLTPAEMHRTNTAERAIRTGKNHFLAGLASTDPSFPAALWDQLFEQWYITLNLLRQSRLNPRLSAYAQLEGQFDYNKTPLAPPGIIAVGHVKPDARKSWDFHGKPGFYVSPAMEHYRCWNLYLPETNTTCNFDTVSFHPHSFKMPAISSADAATHAARNLTHALLNPQPASPIADAGDPDLTALNQLADIFQRQITAKLKPPPHPNHVANAAQLIRPVPENAPQPLPRVAPTIAPRVAHTTTTTTTPTHPPSPRVAADIKASQLIPAQKIPNTPLEKLVELPPDDNEWYLHFGGAVFDDVTETWMEWKELITNPRTRDRWLKAGTKEFGQLAQGIDDIKGTDTIQFIRKSDIPRGRTYTYGRFVVDYRPQKADPYRLRLTVGGNLIKYPGNTSAPTADLETVKILINDIVSTPNAKAVVLDIKNFYLNTPMDRPEYMRVHISQIPPAIVEHYNLTELADEEGYVYIQIDKGMYGLPQAGMLANKLLVKRLARHGYYPCRHTPGLWLHSTRSTKFALVVDDFLVEYVGKQNAEHLLAILKRDYEGVTVDWKAAVFCGIHLDWNYHMNRWCDMSQPGYLPALLKRIGHPPPKRPQHSPHRHTPPNYGSKIQAPEPLDDTAILSAFKNDEIRSIVGGLLFNGRAINSIIRVALSTIATQQGKSTEQTWKDILHLLDFCATHPDPKLRYWASDMILKIHSDAGYLNADGSRSRVGGHFYLGNLPGKPEIYNGAIENPTGILKVLVSSAAEAEIGGLFTNMKRGVVHRQTLTDMRRPQPPTECTVDNSTVDGMANNSVKLNKSRAWEMRFKWVIDKVNEKLFTVKWRPGKQNLADYFTKHHSPAHHKEMRKHYVH